MTPTSSDPYRRPQVVFDDMATQIMGACPPWPGRWGGPDGRLVSERAGLVGLAAFLAVDVVLVVMAMASTHSPGSGAARSVSPVGATVSTRAAGTPATAATSPGTGSTVRVDVAPVSVGLFALDQKTAVRFTVGSCDKGGSAVEVTQDGGATWTLARRRSRPSCGCGCGRTGPSSPSAPTRAAAVFLRSVRASSLGGSWGSVNPAAGRLVPRPAQRRVGGAAGRRYGQALLRRLGGRPVDDRRRRDGPVRTRATVLVSQAGVVVAERGLGGWGPRRGGRKQEPAICRGHGHRGLLAAWPWCGRRAPATALGCAAKDVSKVSRGRSPWRCRADSGWLAVGATFYRVGRHTRHLEDGLTRVSILSRAWRTQQRRCWSMRSVRASGPCRRSICVVLQGVAEGPACPAGPRCRWTRRSARVPKPGERGGHEGDVRPPGCAARTPRSHVTR